MGSRPGFFSVLLDLGRMKDCIIDCSCGGGNTNCRKCGGKGYYRADDLKTPPPLSPLPPEPEVHPPIPKPVVAPWTRREELALRKEQRRKKKQALKKALKKKLALERQQEPKKGRMN